VGEGRTSLRGGGAAVQSNKTIRRGKGEDEEKKGGRGESAGEQGGSDVQQGKPPGFSRPSLAGSKDMLC
jgi:hypothetical protein